MTLPLKVPQKTILVVEDTALVLQTVRMILEQANFTVLAAASANEAMELARYAKTIDLLLSDVMMPNMSGPDLALALKGSRPDMRVMLMSGYDNGALLVLNYGWHFIEKPFVAAQLVAKINEVLQEEIRDQGTDRFDTRADETVPRTVSLTRDREAGGNAAQSIPSRVDKLWRDYTLQRISTSKPTSN